MTDSPHHGSIPEMVSSAAARMPTHTALVQQHRRVPYGSLNGRANQIARYLLSLGIKPEDRIGLWMGRSIEFCIGALGILKAGAAYVPLDPSYPEARRTSIAKDAGLRLILTDAVAQSADLSIPAVQMEAAEIAAQSMAEPEQTSLHPDQLAYVIYTSGSTGTPKGVEVTHGNLRHLVEWHNRAFQIASEDCATLLANTGFDAAVWELWPYLCAGATLFIPDPEVIRQPAALRDFVDDNRISVMFAPTLLAEALMQETWSLDTPLRSMLTGGDTLRTSPTEGLPFSVINNYGPAECTVISTSGEVPQGNRNERLPSIGRPIEGAQVYLLDEHLQEAAAGAEGEIYIGGAGVARGYLNQPELTASRFVTRPNDGTRLYRSGDLGCWNADGSLQFRGRTDQQVKIRGYRIECGEVEAALNSLPGVQGSAVVVLESGKEHRGLCAYLVPENGGLPGREELRQSLRMLLPEYMIPEQFVRLEQMPLNENGKIDRRSLPLPNERTVIPNTVEPPSPIESGLRTVLAALLHVEHIDREDDFFLLGGHSFIAAQLIARIRDRFGVELSLRAVFENPTLAGMAEQIEQRMTVTAR